MFELLLTVHLVGMVLLVGNVYSWWFLLFRARRSADPLTSLKEANETILHSGKVFIWPGGGLITSSGIIMASMAELSVDTTWLWVKVGLFVATCVIWQGVLLRATRGMIGSLTQALESGASEVPESYRDLNRRWHVMGILNYAILAALIVLSVMLP